jgi:hypothetical protein
MGIGKRGQGSANTIWLDLKAKEGTLVAWNRADQREEEFSYVFGRLTDVRVKERHYGDQTGYVINITLRDPDSGERYVVSSAASTRLTCRLLGQLNNADLDQTLYLSPFMLREGEQLSDGSVVRQDGALTSLKYVLGAEDGRLKLSDGIRPFYNDTYGDQIPRGEPVLRADGSPLIQNGQEVKDYTNREALTAELVQTLMARIRMPVDGVPRNDHGVVDPESAAAAALAADRSAMRARA